MKAMYEDCSEVATIQLCYLDYVFKHAYSETCYEEAFEVIKKFYNNYGHLGSFFMDLQPYLVHMIGKQWLIDYATDRQKALFSEELCVSFILLILSSAL